MPTSAGKGKVCHVGVVAQTDDGGRALQPAPEAFDEQDAREALKVRHRVLELGFGEGGAPVCKGLEKRSYEDVAARPYLHTSEATTMGPDGVVVLEGRQDEGSEEGRLE